MLSEDIHLSKALYKLVAGHPELEALTQNLSITTFRYVPHDLNREHEDDNAYLNELNTELLTRLQHSGEAYVSNAVIGDIYALRASIVNFRTSLEDIEALPVIVTRIGRQVDEDLRP
jgi:glutamate/tyrosine decarboxylase-like PLP-dependent enzyme